MEDPPVEAENLPRSDDMLIIGDYGVGAHGPTIMLQLRSAAAAAWLRDMFLKARRSPEGIDLLADPRVRVHGVEQLTLTVRAVHGPYIELQCIGSSSDGKRFQWSASSEGWSYEAGLLDPFVEGRGGHQYLTREGVDDALVEVSFGEPHVRVPG
jgi:hypothetical protein